MAMAFRETGCTVLGLCPDRGHSLLVTSAAERCFKYSGFDPLGSIRHAIQEGQPDIIIPCDDTAVRHLHELYAVVKNSTDSLQKKIARLLERSMGSPDSYQITPARYQLMALARDLGLTVPDTARIREPGDLDAFQHKHPSPGF